MPVIAGGVVNCQVMQRMAAVKSKTSFKKNFDFKKSKLNLSNSHLEGKNLLNKYSSK